MTVGVTDLEVEWSDEDSDRVLHVVGGHPPDTWRPSGGSHDGLSVGTNVQEHLSDLQQNCLPWSPEVFNSPRQILTLLNKVPGYWLQGKTDLANKPRNMQDGSTLKIWEQADRWFKIYGQNVQILAKETFWP